MSDRVKSVTSKKTKEVIEQEILQHIKYYAHNKKDIPARLAELSEEWDIERVLMLNAATLSFVGSVLATTINKKWAILPAVVTAFLAQHAVQGWCPPLPVFRAMGFRTRQEIDSEKYALKALLGELDEHSKSEKLFEAVTD